MSADLLKRLADAGTPMDLIMEVAETIADARAAERVLEKRREKDRERKRNSKDSTESEESAEFQPEALSPFAPPKVSPTPPSNTPPISPKPTARLVLPDWIPLEPWSAFCRMRKATPKVAFTDDAAKRVIAKIERLRGEGHCPTRLLDKAIERGWRTVFPDEDTRQPAVKIVRAMTPAEMHSSIRYHREVLNDEKRAKELEAELAEMVRGIAA